MHRSKRSPIWTLLCVLLVAACRVVEPTATPVNSGSDQELALATVTPSPRPTETEVLPDGPYPPRIVAFEPQPGEEVGTDTTLTWTFSEPMDQQSVERALRLLPETSGRFTWVSDHVVAFSPDELVRGQRYTVSFAADVRSVAGLPLSGNPEYAFHTLSTLQVTRLTPPDGATEIRADAPVLIEFNRPVAPLNCVGGPAQPDTSCPVLSLSFDPPATGDGVWVDTSTYRFAPSPGLQAGIRYGLVLAENVQSTDGAQLVGPYEWELRRQGRAFHGSFQRRDGVGPCLRPCSDLLQHTDGSCQYWCSLQPYCSRWRCGARFPHMAGRRGDACLHADGTARSGGDLHGGHRAGGARSHQRSNRGAVLVDLQHSSLPKACEPCAGGRCPGGGCV